MNNWTWYDSWYDGIDGSMVIERHLASPPATNVACRSSGALFQLSRNLYYVHIFVVNQVIDRCTTGNDTECYILLRACGSFACRPAGRKSRCHAAVPAPAPAHGSTGPRSRSCTSQFTSLWLNESPPVTRREAQTIAWRSRHVCFIAQGHVTWHSPCSREERPALGGRPPWMAFEHHDMVYAVNKCDSLIYATTAHNILHAAGHRVVSSSNSMHEYASKVSK